MNVHFIKLFKRTLVLCLLVFTVAASYAQNTIQYGLRQLNPSNPREVTAVAIPNWTGNNNTISAALFTVLIPAGTVTSPSVDPAPATGAFINITGSWAVQLINAANYSSVGFDPSDLGGYDVYQVVLQNSPSPNATAGTPISLFRFTIPDDCIGSLPIRVLINNENIQQRIFDNLGANFNNNCDVSVNDAPSVDIYLNNSTTFNNLQCPLDTAPDAVNDIATTNEDTPVDIMVVANDNFGTNGPSLSAITITVPPTNGTASVNNNGTPTDPTDDFITYTPNANYNGPDQLTYQICDRDGDCDTAIASITVNAVNDPPVAVDDTYSINEDFVLTNNVTGNDSDVDGPSVSITLVTGVTNGTLVLNTNGSFTYTPNANYNGPDSFVYSYCDLGTPNLCDTASVSITVNPVNDAPVAVDDSYSVNEDNTLTNNVTPNDSDVDGPSVSITLVTGVTNGTLTLNMDGSFTYTPNANYNGPDSFVYSYCDLGTPNLCDSASVSITVNPVNDPPVAVDDSYTLNEDNVLTNNVTANDSDVDGPSVSITLVTGVTNGTLTLNTDGSFTYTPNANYNGPDSFVYSYCDLGTPNLCDTASVSITVNPVNDAPVAVDDSYSVNEDNTLTNNVTPNDSDVDGPSVSITLVTGVTNGTLTLNTDGSFTYTPNANYNGPDSFVYSYCDLGTPNLCDTASVSITVNPVNDPPVAVDDSYTLNEDNVFTNNVTGNDSDVDGPSVSITLVTGVTNGTLTLNTNGSFTYTPNANYNGPDSFVYSYCDLGTPNLCDTASVSITVNPVNDPPTIAQPPVTTPEDTPVTFCPTLADVDAGAILTMSICGGPSNGTASLNPVSNCITYSPNLDYNGQDTICVRVCDEFNACAEIEVPITVTPVNDPPVANDDNYTMSENTTLVRNVVENDTDVDGPSVIISVVTPPAVGTLNFDPGTPGQMTYTPPTGFSGIVSFVYQYCDGGTPNLCDQATVNITISATDDCNTPLAGINYVLDRVNPGIVGLLLGGSTLQNVIDQNLNNFAEVNTVLAVAGSSIVSVKNVNGSFPAGRRTGFVIEGNGGLLTASLLSSLQIRTYNNNVLQETATFGGGSALGLTLLGTSDGKRRIDFVTTQAFDEVELFLNGTLSALTSLRVYYAFQENPTCDSNCETEVIPANGFSPTIVGARTGPSGVCVLCSFTGGSNVIDNLPNTAGTINFGVSLGGSVSVSVSTGATQPAGSDAGFVISQSSLLGLLNLGVLSNYRIRTYLSGTLRDDLTLNSALASVTLLPGDDRLSLSIPTTLSYNEIRLTITQGVGLINTTSVFNAFVRYDSDSDGFPDCLDACPTGSDAILNSLGKPLACNPDCLVQAGSDISACPSTGNGTAQLRAAGSGQTWSASTLNPGPTSINSAGLVSGLTTEGLYTYILSDAVCADSVVVRYEQSSGSLECGNPIVGPNTIVVSSALGSVNPGRVVDGDLSNFMEYNNLLSVLSNVSIIRLRDTFNTYTVPRRTGFDISLPGGLLSLSALSGFEIRTYLNGTLRETANVTNALLGAGVVSIGSNRQRLSFNATLTFNEIELRYSTVAGVGNTLRVFNAFEEPTTCASTANLLNNPEGGCYEPLTVSSPYKATISSVRTGFTGAACALCDLNSISHIVDSDPSNFGTQQLGVGLLTTGSVSVRSTKTIASGYEAGFAISLGGSLAEVSVLTNLTISTWRNGVQQQSFVANNSLVSLTAIGGSTNLVFVGFRTTSEFDEVRLSVNAPVSVNPLSNLNIYYAYVRLDTDNDGVPDCQDKCCSGSDLFDADGDGLPDACDTPIDAVNDVATTLEDTPVDIDVLLNDAFGGNGPGLLPIQLVNQAVNGVATVNNGGTPTDPTDDTFTYTPNLNFFGPDQFRYRICDAINSCDTATVTITIQAVNDAPIAVDDTYSVDEDIVLTNTVITNDSDVDGPSVSVTLVTNVANGTLVLNTNGSFTYTPNANYNGPDSFVYSYCDLGTPNLCDTASVSITVNPVNDTPQIAQPPVVTDEDTPVTFCPILTDPDVVTGDVLTLSICGGPTFGTAVINPITNCVTYTPNQNYFGPDNICIRVCDLANACSTVDVPITVNPINDAPIANNDNFNVNEDNVLNANVTVNDTDVDGPQVSITLVTNVANGVLVLSPNGAFSYTPNQNYNGPESFVYSYCDLGTPNLCDTATVFITVNPVNDGPIANDDAYTTNEGVAVVDNVAANDTDVDGPQVIITLVPGSGPQNGVLNLNTNGSFTYTPNVNFAGTDQFTYQYCDGGTPNLCDVATVTITVQGNFVRLTSKVALQGALLNSTTPGIMRGQLRTLPSFPLTTPYSGPRFVKVANDVEETIDPSVLGDFGNNSIVDWIFLELRNPLDVTEVVATRSALLQRDGDIVDVDGISPVLFSSTNNGSYFVTVLHRNHLGASTGQPILLTSTPNLVDFTNINLPLFSRTSTFAGVEMAVVNGSRALWLGNTNGDDRTVFSGQATDKNNVFNAIDQAPANFLKGQSFVLNGYNVSDVDLNGQSIFAGQNNDIDPIFNVVDSHPRNLTFRLQSFNIIEQVPDRSNP